jgi:hypothetical protein
VQTSSGIVSASGVEAETTVQVNAPAAGFDDRQRNRRVTVNTPPGGLLTLLTKLACNVSSTLSPADVVVVARC